MADTAPQIGEIVNYMYLWHEDHLRGHDQGTKERPCLVITTQGNKIAVLPITHAAPHDEQRSVKIPAHIKRRMGLEGKDAWIRCNEYNLLSWEDSPDLLATSRLLRHNFNHQAAGQKNKIEIPPFFLNKARETFNAALNDGTACGVSRDSGMPANYRKGYSAKPR